MRTLLVSAAVTACTHRELPSFRRSAALILSHAIGRLEGDGPVCQQKGGVGVEEWGSGGGGSVGGGGCCEAHQQSLSSPGLDFRLRE